jgi:hypothetical protein
MGGLARSERRKGGDVPNRSQVLIGRAFSTTFDWPDEPCWEPLERFARLVWQMPELPQFHPGEFMYMVAVRNKRLDLRIHLYKHIDTRRHLNLDDAGHAYAFQSTDIDADLDRPEFSGRYKRYRSPLDAIAGLCLWKFEVQHLIRSFPPETWPDDEC